MIKAHGMKTREGMLMSYNVVSTFDGMSCGRLALHKLAVPVGHYYASEVDEPAMKVAQANFPTTQQMGDVTKWRDWDIDWSKIDLFIGGSPCQGFSLAGKQLAFKDPRSKLFFEYVDILQHIQSVNPNVKFMLENVRMRKDYLDAISKLLGVTPIKVDSALVSGQTRTRFYWCNWNTTQPQDKGIVLQDVLESGVVDRDKAHCIDANYWKGGNLKSYYVKNRRQLVFECEQRAGDCEHVLDDAYRREPICTNKKHYRKLTPLECERLQTVPDGYTAHVSNTQRYRMLGNGWTVDVVAHLFSNLFDEALQKKAKSYLVPA
jgi:site-specific DNA-cytosine methylase